MKLNDLHGAEGSHKKKKRVGRGTSSGHGKTSGRGNKGQNSRTGGGVRPGFEGGQTPLYRRLPKEQGFKNLMFKKTYAVINLRDLSDIGTTINKQILVEKGKIRGGELLKVLGDGDIKKAITIEADHFSESALKKIEAAGGKAIVTSKQAK
jgi:large subunit ribosomal protein L15